MTTDDPVLKRFGLASKSQKMKYDRFISYYMASCNARESYAKVFKTTNDQTINKQSWLLVRHPYVVMQLRIKNKKMDEDLSEKALMNRERILTELESILESCKADKNYITSLKALDQLAKVVGAYAPIKEEVTHKGITINYIQPESE